MLSMPRLSASLKSQHTEPQQAQQKQRTDRLLFTIHLSACKYMWWVHIVDCLPAQAYEGMLFREALKAGLYDLQKARDSYRLFTGDDGMHRDLALRYAKVCTSH